MWRASTLTFGVLALLVLALVIISQFGIGSETEVGRLALSTAVASIPVAAWFGFLFRSAARSGPEVSPLLPTITIFAGLLAAAVVRPILFDLLDMRYWLAGLSPSGRFAANITLNGFVHTTALYTLIRYTVWRTPAFAHRVDGPLFALGAGLGYGAMLSLLVMLEDGSVTPLNGGLGIISQICAYLAPALTLGYFLGRNRFEDLPAYFMPAGLALAAGECGLMLYAGHELNSTRLSISQDGFSPWPGLIFSLALLVITYAAVFGLLRRHNALTRARLRSKDS